MASESQTTKGAIKRFDTNKLNIVEFENGQVLVAESGAADLSNAVGPDFNPNRFVPFVVMHEFEGLLFSDCKAFCQGIGRQDLEPKFQQIRNEFNTPEDINDSPITCPSMRVKNLVPGYEKPLYGTLAALEVGLSRIRGQCPHFDDWLRQLESVVHKAV